MNLSWNILNRRKKLVVSWTPANLSLLLFDRSGEQKYESIFLQEASLDGVAARVSEFLGGTNPSETLLILPRSEVLQKEITIAKAGSQAQIKEALELKLSQILPYSPREMAYGLMLEDEASDARGLLFAITEKKLQEILGFMKSLGLKISEIVSEDQTFCWEPSNGASSMPILRVDQSPERILFAVVRDRQVVVSRSMIKGREDLENVASEASLSFLELGQKPGKVLLSGNWEEREVEEFRRQFSMPVERPDPYFLNGREIPSVLWGGRFWGALPYTSLLPSDQKIQKRKLQQIQLLREVVVAAGVLAAACILLGICHLQFLKWQKARLEREAHKLSSEVKGIREIASSLDKIRDAEFSKRRVLDLMKDLAERMPGSIKPTELQTDEAGIVFKGESSSHILLSQAVEVLEKMESLRETKLEHTKLRKRLNQDYFEFEVSSKWKE
jgi:Tfp pilus assembly protein PilN